MSNYMCRIKNKNIVLLKLKTSFLTFFLLIVIVRPEQFCYIFVSNEKSHLLFSLKP